MGSVEFLQRNGKELSERGSNGLIALTRHPTVVKLIGQHTDSSNLNKQQILHDLSSP